MTLTKKQVAVELQVSPAIVATLIRTGQLEAFDASKKGHSKKPRWRVTQTALEQFQAARTNRTQPRAHKTRGYVPQIVGK